MAALSRIYKSISCYKDEAILQQPSFASDNKVVLEMCIQFRSLAPVSLGELGLSKEGT